MSALSPSAATRAVVKGRRCEPGPCLSLPAGPFPERRKEAWESAGLPPVASLFSTGIRARAAVSGRCRTPRKPPHGGHRDSWRQGETLVARAPRDISDAVVDSGFGAGRGASGVCRCARPEGAAFQTARHGAAFRRRTRAASTASPTGSSALSARSQWRSSLRPACDPCRRTRGAFANRHPNLADSRLPGLLERAEGFSAGVTPSAVVDGKHCAASTVNVRAAARLIWIPVADALGRHCRPA